MPVVVLGIGRCIGLAVSGKALWVTGDARIFKFADLLEPGQKNSENHDALYGWLTAKPDQRKQWDIAMLTLSNANSASDFAIVAEFARAFGEWDAAQVQPYGISREEVLRAFHSDTAGSLAEKFGSEDAKLLVARWEGTPAGCLAFNPFDHDAIEIHKFYVDPNYRGKGIGGALMRAALADMEKGRRRKVILHTAVYMKDAISVYESFGFAICPRFRETPEIIKQTDCFMSRAI
jgi:ribosomal protein S18 acetylase RimI-like enzyme